MTDLLSAETAVRTPRSDQRRRPARAPGLGEIPDEPEADEVTSAATAGSRWCWPAWRAARRRRTSRARSPVLGVARLGAAASALTALTWAHVFSFLDARTPLLVADAHGVRIRLGRTWRGMPWTDIEEVEHAPRRGLLRDGRLVLFPRELDGELAMLGRPAAGTRSSPTGCTVRRSPCRSA